MIGSTWMWDARNHLGNLSIKVAPIPGSHDSGTYPITSESGIAPESDIEWLNKLPRPLSTFAETTIANWGKSQRLSFSEQLNGGIRYFDLRVCKVDSPYDNLSEYYLCHGMIGESVNNLLSAVTDFINNSHEIVILDFNHFYHMASVDHDALIHKLITTLSNNLAINQGPVLPTFQQLWSSTSRVILYYRTTDYKPNSPYIWGNSKIVSHWPRTENVEELLKDIDQTLFPTNPLPSTQETLNVCQCILTPNTDTVVEGFVNKKENSLLDMVDIGNPKIISWLKDKLKEKPGQFTNTSNLNIFILDDVPPEDMLSITELQINRLTPK